MAKEVLIVGAGFGGLEAGRELAGRHSVNVTIIDQRNHHLFQPLLYQVAISGGWRRWIWRRNAPRSPRAWASPGTSSSSLAGPRTATSGIPSGRSSRRG